jgi:hypothetical protein
MQSLSPAPSPALAALAFHASRYKTDGVPHEAQGVSPLPDTTRVKVDTLAGAPAGLWLRQGTHCALWQVLQCAMLTVEAHYIPNLL